MSTTLRINGITHQVDLPDDVPLLWVLRDEVGLTGTKFGCGVAACGACTVHIDGEAVRSCQVALSDVWGDVTTIEGIGTPRQWPLYNRPGWPIRWRNVATVSPARSCRPRASLAENPSPSDAEIDEAMQGQPVPLRDLSPYPRRHPRRRQDDEGGLSHGQHSQDRPPQLSHRLCCHCWWRRLWHLQIPSTRPQSA